MNDENSNCLIIDTGSWSCKAGLSNEDTPQITMPSFVSKEKIENGKIINYGSNALVSNEKADSIPLIKNSQIQDWENIENNVFHVTEEMTVSGLHENRRPDIVLFVNGIPLVIIENKRRDKNESIEEAVSQHIRNQKEIEKWAEKFEIKA